MNEEKADKFCPICGPEEAMAGKDDITYEYEGKTYYFCSLGCLDAFKKSPEKYSKISEENHEGHDDDKGHDHADHGSHEGHDYK
ncbi:MAG: YHS domain-containing protein [Candidatus Omnitrophica bacterium]|nr:YHS domain-containing protein [Candidatus Omnitrophota bacterium]